MLSFHLEPRSGVPTYAQLVQQVTQAVRLGVLAPGDQLPTVKEVVGLLAINPNTVLRAYRELDHLGVTEGRRGVGTFIAPGVTALEKQQVAELRGALEKWVQRARAAGLTAEDVDALFATTVRGSLARVA